jgi:hypothetical protein
VPKTSVFDTILAKRVATRGRVALSNLYGILLGKLLDQEGRCKKKK